MFMQRGTPFPEPPQAIAEPPQALAEPSQAIAKSAAHAAAAKRDRYRLLG